MNIAIICDAVTHQLAGSFVSTLRFVDKLCLRGHKVVLFASKGKDGLKIDSYGGTKIYRFRSVLLPKSEGQFYLFFARSRTLERIFVNERIDLVHIMIPSFSALSAIKAARKLGLRVVAHSHTQPENLFLNLPKFLGKRKLNKWFYKWMIRIYSKADIVICPSIFSEKKLHQYAPFLNTQVISNGVDLRKFGVTDATSLFKKYSLEKGKKRILYVGRLHPEKSVDTLIRAFSIVLEKEKDAALDIVGSGYLSDDFTELIKRLGIQMNARLYGRVSDKDLLLFYNSAYVFVLPSLAELEGMVVLEAMACGKPIIVADSEESASVYFVKGNGFLFEPKNEKCLAQKLLKLLKDKNLRRKMASESLKEVKKYDLEDSVSKIERLYLGEDGRKVSR